MSVCFAIANRKGGVGKSTITTMLAHSLSVWGQYRVLVLDLDSQANTSLILFGGNNWAKARVDERTAADYLLEPHSTDGVDYDKYIFHNVGDIAGFDRRKPQISLMPGSLEMEDYERELLHRLSGSNANLYNVEQGVRGRIARQLRKFGPNFDVVLIDCPPGISFATEAALQTADKVVVPFRPDYVSLFAVDRIARMIEDKPNPKSVQDVLMDQRRYVTVANLCRTTSAHQRLIEELKAYHPMLQTQIPQSAAVANAFDWEGTRKNIAKKYGSAVGVLQQLYMEILTIIHRIEKSRETVHHGISKRHRSR